MILKPKTLIRMVIISAIVMIATSCEAHNPDTVIGFAFWGGMAVFAFCFHQLDKNENYYKNDIDNDELS